MAAKIFRINYKSDFILTLVSDAGWMTPFCIKFWTGSPMLAYYASWDGETYTHCAPVAGDPTKLLVQFDDHHLPIGDLKFQIAYHFTVADFPNDTEDEVLNQANITTEIDGETYQVMLDFTGETAPEIQFSLPAYANEAQRIANEQQRIANEEQRIAAETVRIQNEQQRIAQEQIRQQNEQQRINQEQARVNEYAGLKADAVAATGAASDAAALANQKAQLAADKAALAQSAANLANAKAQLAADKAALADAAATLANQKAALAQQKAEYAQEQGTYSKNQGDYAKEQGDYSKAQGDYAKDQGDYSKSKGDYAKDQGDYSKQQGDYAKEQGEICAADHLVAVEDHQTAAADHQTAASDHQTATADHTQAGNDHTRAESDHTRAESDHAAVEVYVDSLGAFDISAYHATGGVLAEYADLTAALGTNGANIPDALRKGGMSVKFVQSSDNKYVQYRLMTDDFSTTVSNWQGVDEEPTARSNNLVKSGGVAGEFNKINNSLYGKGSLVVDISNGSGNYITYSDGELHGSQDYKVTDKIYVDEGDVFNIDITGATSTLAILAAYGANDNYIQQDSIAGLGANETYRGTYTVGSGVKYLMFSCRNIYASYFRVTRNASEGRLTKLEGQVEEIETTVVEEVAELDEQVNGKASYNVDLSDGDNKYVTYETGYVNNSPDTKSKKIFVGVGDKFSYSAVVSDAIALIAAYQSDGTYIKANSVKGLGYRAVTSGTYEVTNANIAYIIVGGIVAGYMSNFSMSYIGTKGLEERVEDLEGGEYIIANSMKNIGINDLTKAGSGTVNVDGSISLAVGYSNRFYWNCSTVATCYTMAAKFKCASGTPSFTIGKDQYGDGRFGGHITVEGSKLLFFKDSNEDGTYTHLEYNLGFTLNVNEVYSMWIHRFIDYETGNRGFDVEVVGEYNEHFRETLANGPWLGKPYIASDNAACTVYNYNFSLQYDFDLPNAKVGIWGHSYVEADSLTTPSDKLKSFANLIGNVLGHDKVLNFGLGGEYAQRLLSRVPGECLFAANITYALIINGANDTSYNIDTIIGYMDDIAKYFIGKNITPIFMTNPPIPAFSSDANAWLVQLNNWIKSSGYLYTDTYQVFVDANNNVRTNLYLADNTHPTVEGHQLIFNRIKMDCPYLF